MNDISKIIADKILGIPLDKESEMALERWLSESTYNQATFERAQKGELSTIILKKESENFGEKMSNKVFEKIYNRRKRNIFRILTTSVAAAILAVSFLLIENSREKIAHNDAEVVVVAEKLTASEEITLITADGNSVKLEKSETLDSIINKNKSVVGGTIASNTIIVPLKKVFNMLLPDGTKVWLNSGSKLIFPVQFSDTLRSVELIGEAFFEVVKDKKAPFIVKTKMLETKVVGTKFMVSSYEDDTNTAVALVEGKVNVSSTTTKHSSILKAGEGVSYNSQSNDYKVVNININDILNRKSELFMFDDVPLSYIMTSLSRWYGVEFELNDRKIENEIFYLKTIKYDSISDIMMLLKDTKKIDFTINNNKITIKSLMPM